MVVVVPMLKQWRNWRWERTSTSWPHFQYVSRCRVSVIHQWIWKGCQLIQAPVIKINIPFPFLSLKVASPQFNLLLEPFVNFRPKVLSVTNATFCCSSLAFFGWLVLVAVGTCWVFIFGALIFINTKNNLVVPCNTSLWAIWLMKDHIWQINKTYQEHIVDEISLLKLARLDALSIPHATVNGELFDWASLLPNYPITDLSSIKHLKNLKQLGTYILAKCVSNVWGNSFGLRC